MAALIKCKMCGGDLALTEGSTIAVCEYCGTQQTVPTMDDEKKLVQFERADRLRRNCEFDKAAGVYESIVADFRQEAEAYWGLVLCKYGIEYVDDPATGKKIPTCHRSSFESIMEDPNFDQVLENADVMARKVYRDEAKVIEEIRKGIIEVSAKEEPYDIFICYKETDAEGQRTIDSVLAQDIYDALTEKGYRTFFARITLEDKLGQEYEPYIFAALNSAKVMLAVGTDYEHFNAVWVKNEWSRYLKLMEKDKAKHLIPCFKGIDAYDMPKEFNKLQAQDLGKVGAIQDLLRGIDKLISVKPAAAPVAAGMQTDDVNRMYIYNSALEAMNNKKVKKAKEAVKKLESLGDWGDAPQQLENAKKNLKKRKRRRATRRIITWVLILAIIGGIVGFALYQDYQNKKDRYEKAVAYMDEGNYESAYNNFLKAEDYLDAPERAAEAERILNDVGRKLLETANEMADMGFYMTAVTYLENSIGTYGSSISSETQDQIFEKMNTYIMTAEEHLNKWYETAEDSVDSDLMAEFEEIFTVTMEAGAHMDAMMMMYEFGIGNTAFAEKFIIYAIEAGMMEYIPLEELAACLPELVPVFDMNIAKMTDPLKIADMMSY